MKMLQLCSTEALYPVVKQKVSLYPKQMSNAMFKTFSHVPSIFPVSLLQSQCDSMLRTHYAESLIFILRTVHPRIHVPENVRLWLPPHPGLLCTFRRHHILDTFCNVSSSSTFNKETFVLESMWGVKEDVHIYLRKTNSVLFWFKPWAFLTLGSDSYQ